MKEARKTPLASVCNYHTCGLEWIIHSVADGWASRGDISTMQIVLDSLSVAGHESRGGYCMGAKAPSPFQAYNLDPGTLGTDLGPRTEMRLHHLKHPQHAPFGRLQTGRGIIAQGYPAQ